jgi:hypothetical protein
MYAASHSATVGRQIQIQQSHRMALPGASTDGDQFIRLGVTIFSTTTASPQGRSHEVEPALTIKVVNTTIAS